MANQLGEEARVLFNTFRNRLNRKQLKSIDEDTSLRIIERLEVLEKSCPGCEQHLQGYVSDLKRLVNLNELEVLDLKLYVKMKQQIIVHLLKEHHIVQKHYYLSFTVPLGIMIGITVGLMFDRFIFLIAPLFLVIGVSMGVYLTKRASNKGLIL